MPPPSKTDADALRHWLDVTISAYADDGIELALPPKPLGLMILVQLWLEDGETVRYSSLRVALRLKRDKSLPNAIDLLERGGLVAKVTGRDDARERELRITGKGRDVVGTLIHARHPHSK